MWSTPGVWNKGRPAIQQQRRPDRDIHAGMQQRAIRRGTTVSLSPITSREVPRFSTSGCIISCAQCDKGGGISSMATTDRVRTWLPAAAIRGWGAHNTFLTLNFEHSKMNFRAHQTKLLDRCVDLCICVCLFACIVIPSTLDVSLHLPV